MTARGASPNLVGKAAGGRRLIAVVYADMVGYSRLIGLDDAGTLRRLRTLRRALIDPAIREHGGHLVQTGGDSLLIAFDSIDGAVRCAVKIQQQVPTHDGDHPPDRCIRFRMGINIGDVISEGTDLHGDGVNIAARLEAVSPVGGICVSRAVVDHLHSRLDLSFEPNGTLALKNIARPVEAFVLRLDPPAEASHLSRQTTSPRLSLVVLPFDSRGGSVEDYTADGITEDLTADLSRLTGYMVVDRNTASTYGGRSIDIKRVGTELGVRYAVEGRVRAAGGALRINVQLISTETGMHLWADRFDIDREAAGHALDDIVQLIRAALNTRLLNVESTRSAMERPFSPDATDVLLQARTLGSLPPNPQILAQRIALYERAVELDPRSVRALIGLAEALIDSVSDWGNPSAPTRFLRADELVRRAELLRPDDAYVMYVRLYLLRAQGRWSEVIPAAQRAIEVHPKMPAAHLSLGICLMRDGRAADAIVKFEHALRLRARNHPNNYNHYRTIGTASIFLEKYEEAISWLQRSLAANPTQDPRSRGNTHAAIAAAQALAGQHKEARLSASEAIRFCPTLTARAYYRSDITNSSHAAQVSRLRDGLRLAGIRDHADEDADFGVISEHALHTDYEALTPTTVPGASTIRTPNLAVLLDQRGPTLVLDTGRAGMSIPGAVRLWGSGIGGSLSDEFQDRLRLKIQQLAEGDQSLAIVTVGWNAERYDGRNLALRLVALGYTQVHWYRGGREAWAANGQPEAELTQQEW